MEQKTLFRNEDCYGSGFRSVEKVIFYEMTELYNTDVFYYCMENYPLSKSLKNNMNKIIDMIDNDDVEDIYYNKNYIEDIIHNLIEELSLYFNTDIKFCLWLGNRDHIINCYYNYSDEDITLYEYETSNIILSNLNNNDYLFGYNELPNIVNEETIQLKLK